VRDCPRLSVIILLTALMGLCGCATPPDADGDVTGGPDNVLSPSESASDGLCECPENPQVDDFNAALQALAQGDFEAAAAALSRHADLGGGRNRSEARAGRELADLLARYPADGGTIASLPGSDRAALIQLVLTLVDRLETKIATLGAQNAQLAADLEKREEALKRLRELTLGQPEA
jgi:hypothetical protein